MNHFLPYFQLKRRTLVSLIGAAAIVLSFADVAPKAQESEGVEENGAVCAGILAPVEVTNAAVADLMQAREDGRLTDSSGQPALLGKYLRLVGVDINAPPADPLDRAALGDLLFLNFHAYDAHVMWSGLLERTDLIGRLAWQRVMQMRRVAFDRPEEVREMVAQYRERFAPIEDDIFGAFQQVAGLASADFAAGEADRAVALILEEIQATPATAPFRSFSIPMLLAERIQESGREQEVKSLLREKLAGLERLASEWAGQEPSAEEELARRTQAPAWYWLFQRIKPDETLRAARARQLEELIAALEAYLSP